jgi:hypothetical protein
MNRREGGEGKGREGKGREGKGREGMVYSWLKCISIIVLGILWKSCLNM